jgi:hypothetical protein
MTASRSHTCLQSNLQTDQTVCYVDDRLPGVACQLLLWTLMIKKPGKDERRSLFAKVGMRVEE